MCCCQCLTPGRKLQHCVSGSSCHQGTPSVWRSTLGRISAAAPSSNAWSHPVPCMVMTCRTWILTLNYGYCFGVELTINNIIVSGTVPNA